MAQRMRKVFEEESDEDSVTTDYTDQTEEKDVWDVERILLKDKFPDGDMRYLVKWEGFPLGESTWEPRENISGEAFRQWERHELAVSKGKAEAFKLHDYEFAVEEHHTNKADRHERRNAKRRKRGLPVLSETGSDHGNDADGDSPSPPPITRGRQSKKTESPASKAIGNERKLLGSDQSTRSETVSRSSKKRSVTVAASSSEDSSSDREASSSADSLFEEIADKANRELNPKRIAPVSKPRPVSASTSTSTPGAKVNSTSVTTATKQRLVNGKKKSVGSPTTPQSSRAVAPPATARATAAGTSTTSKPLMTAKRTPMTQATSTPNLSTSWTVPKERRHRQYVSGETPKDSKDAQFGSLSIQNRYRNYSKNEREPNLSELNIVDPKTGARKEAVASSSIAPVPTRIHPVYQRRVPASNERQREITPPSRPNPIGQTFAGLQVPSTGSNSAVQPTAQGNLAPGGVRPMPVSVCKYWLDGDSCTYSARDCRYLHNYPPGYNERSSGIPGTTGRNGLTCHYWRTFGKCKKGDTCEFAHYDTGINAAPPGTHEYPPDHNERVSGISGAIVKKDQTCHFWRTTGTCTKGVACEFAHHDTGINAGAPGTFRTGLLRSAISSDVGVAHVAPTTGSTNKNGSPMERAATREATEYRGPEFRHGNASSIVTTTSQVPQNKGVDRALADRPPLAKRPSVSSSTVRATITWQFQGSASDVDMPVTLEIFDQVTFTNLAGLEPSIIAQRAILLSDVKALLNDYALRNVTCAGSIIVDSLYTSRAENVAEFCKMNEACLVAGLGKNGTCILIYPSNSDRWRLFGNKSTAESALRYIIFPDLPVLDLTASYPNIDIRLPQEKQSPIEDLGQKLLDFDKAKLFERRLSTDRPVFLMMPSEHSTELAVYIRYFVDLGCKVYHSGTAGSWDFFRSRYSKGCLIMVHPEMPLWQIPGLHEMLAPRGGVNFFSVGVDRMRALLDNREPTFGIERLFPHGSVTLITDEVFQHHPEKATTIIDGFLAIARARAVGGDTSKIATRPGIKDWLEQLVVENLNKFGPRELRWARLYERICDLCPPSAEDPRDPPNPLPTSHLVSVAPELLPAVNELGEGPSTDYLVNWFAAWCLEHATQHRRFLVCYQPKAGKGKMVMDEIGRISEQIDPDPYAWGKRYQHLGVFSPEQVIEKQTGKKA